MPPLFFRGLEALGPAGRMPALHHVDVDVGGDDVSVGGDCSPVSVGGGCCGLSGRGCRSEGGISPGESGGAVFTSGEIVCVGKVAAVSVIVVSVIGI